MPSSRANGKRRAVVNDDDVVGSAQSPESVARDTATEVEVLEAIAASRASGSASGSAPATEEKKRRRKRKDLQKLQGWGELAGAPGAPGGGGGASSKKKKKEITAIVQLARYMQGDKKGQLTGRVFYAINQEYDENEEFKKLAHEVLKAKAQYFPDWNKWAVRCPTAALALKMHEAVKAATSMPVTSKNVNPTLDVTPYEHAAIGKPHFDLAYSEQFETQKDGVLPRSIMIIGKTFDYKDFVKAKFTAIRYLDLIFEGGTVTKAAWILPESAQTEETGTLADYLEELGATVDEIDADGGEGDSEEDDERDDEALIDGEAVEGDDDE